MTNQNKLETVFERIVSAVRESGGVIVQSMLRADSDPGYRVNLSLQDFLLLVGHCRPRVVYAFADKFDARESLLIHLEIEDDDADDFMAKPEVKAIIEQAASHNGELGSFIVNFFADGVLHTVCERASWVAEFEESADALQQSLDEQGWMRNEEREALESEDFRAKAKQLCEHSKFNDGRPSHDKRSYLARSLFPDVDGTDIHRIVNEATNMSWLAEK
jgi:hypothetical protein